jgi:hypothetical protein
VRVAQLQADLLDNAVQMGQDFVVPKAEDTISELAKRSSPHFIMRSLNCMLAAIELNDELLLWTAEVSDVVCDRVLPAELHPQAIPTTKTVP